MNYAVKMLDAAGGRVGGYLVVWGSPALRDLDGEYFTPETDLGLEWYERRPVLYHHGLDGELGPAVIGVIETLKADQTGLWAEAQLNLRRRYVRAVQRLVEQGRLNWSSGSLPHLVEVAADGRIKRWPIVEGSLTPAPAEPRRTDARTIKSAYEAAGLSSEFRVLSAELKDKTEENMQDEMDIMQVEDERPARKRLPVASADEALKARIQVGSPFDRLEAMDLLHGYMMLRSAKSFHGVSEPYANALAHKISRAGLSAIKANELSHSTQTGFGDEWVPDLWSAQIWQKARLENVILPLFRALEMPSNPFEVPVEGADPSVYYVPETSDEDHLTLGSGNTIPDSKIGSGKVQLTAKKLALRVGFSAELVEDAIVPVLNIYREQAMRAIADSIDYVLLNGDTESGATGNINSDAAAPSANARYLAFNGLRKLALANAANKADAGNNAPDLTKLRTARFKLPARYSARPADLAWIVDGGTYAKFLAMEQFLTMDKAGPLATAMTGQIGLVDGAPALVSAEMPLTEADGKVGSGTNDRGTALCVYRPGWFVGYRRRIAVSVDYLPYTDSYQLTATVRLAFAPFDNAVASVLFNVAV
ncbi:MAG: phage major capsid protein [Chloroflexi bacterium]|nr:phage major capsid protein [Chloroflexota bacterium]MDL1886093.1 phage major capsid protein [Anaerolineae bacterium CFX8]